MYHIKGFLEHPEFYEYRKQSKTLYLVNLTVLFLKLLSFKIVSNILSAHAAKLVFETDVNGPRFNYLVMKRKAQVAF